MGKIIAFYANSSIAANSVKFLMATHSRFTRAVAVFDSLSPRNLRSDHVHVSSAKNLRACQCLIKTRVVSRYLGKHFTFVELLLDSSTSPEDPGQQLAMLTNCRLGL